VDVMFGRECSKGRRKVERQSEKISQRRIHKHPYMDNIKNTHYELRFKYGLSQLLYSHGNYYTSIVKIIQDLNTNISLYPY
jgi:hypothetical protein